jgi:hypothetical protein
MKEYKISLSEEKNILDNNGASVSEVHIVLQIWQDLRKSKILHPEDRVIEAILEQVLRHEYNGDIPKGYDAEQGVMNFAPNEDGALSQVEKIESPRFEMPQDYNVDQGGGPMFDDQGNIVK